MGEEKPGTNPAGTNPETIVVKIGSSTLTDESGRLRLGPMAGRVAELCGLWRAGHNMVLAPQVPFLAGWGHLGSKQDLPRSLIYKLRRRWVKVVFIIRTASCSGTKMCPPPRCC